MKYSLWVLEHESIYIVRAYKIKDTNTINEINKWTEKSLYHVASFYREEEELNADYLQTFENY